MWLRYASTPCMKEGLGGGGSQELVGLGLWGTEIPCHSGNPPTTPTPNSTHSNVDRLLKPMRVCQTGASHTNEKQTELADNVEALQAAAKSAPTCKGCTGGKGEKPCHSGLFHCHAAGWEREVHKPAAAQLQHIRH